MSAYATAPLGRSSLAVPVDPSARARAVPRVCCYGRTQGPTPANAPSPSDGVLDSLIGQIAERIASAVVAQLAAARPDDQDEWLDSRRAAEYLGVHRDTLRKLAAERAIPAEQDGRGCKLFFRRVDLDEWRLRSRIPGRIGQAAMAHDPRRHHYVPRCARRAARSARSRRAFGGKDATAVCRSRRGMT